MTNRKIRHLPVGEDGAGSLGIVSNGIVQGRLDELETERASRITCRLGATWRTVHFSTDS